MSSLSMKPKFESYLSQFVILKYVDNYKYVVCLVLGIKSYLAKVRH